MDCCWDGGGLLLGLLGLFWFLWLYCCSSFQVIVVAMVRCFCWKCGFDDVAAVIMGAMVDVASVVVNDSIIN